MPLRRRIRLIFAVLAILVGLDFAVDRVLVAQRNDARSEARDRWEPAREVTSMLLFSLVDQETSERGYIITGDEELVAAYTTEGENADRALQRLERLVGDDGDIRPQLRRTRDRIAAWRQLGAAYEIEAKRAGRDEAASALVSSGTSQRLFDEARVEIDELVLSIRGELDRNESALRRLERRSGVLRLASTAAAVAAVLLSGRLMNRWLSRPLVEVAEAVRTVAAGDLDHEIPAPGPPELSGLGRDVEAMRRRILEEVDDALRARESLAQRGMIVLTLRDELAPPPVEPPAGLEVALRFRPSESLVAGDWYELRRDGQRLTFVVADVSGHGPTAGVFALKTKLLVQVALRQGLGPAAAWQWVSEHLDDTGEQFLTGVIGTIDAAEGELTYASAGHPPLLLVDPTGIVPLAPTGPIVGAFAGSWSERSTPFGPGTKVIAYSDGLLEVQETQGAWADLAQLQASLSAEEAPTAERLAELCLAFHDRHNGRDHRDDVTIVSVGSVSG